MVARDTGRTNDVRHISRFFWSVWMCSCRIVTARRRGIGFGDDCSDYSASCVGKLWIDSDVLAVYYDNLILFECQKIERVKRGEDGRDIGPRGELTVQRPTSFDQNTTSSLLSSLSI